VRSAARQSQGSLDDVLGLGRGISTSGVTRELAPVKLLPSGNVLSRFALQALVQVAPVVQPFEFGKLVFRMAEQINTLAADECINSTSAVSRGAAIAASSRAG